MKQLIVLLAFISLSSSVLHAQLRKDSKKEITQFSGIVKDKVSQAEIPFAIVYVDRERRGTVSTVDGFFSFAVAKGDVILAKSLGYEPLKIVIPEDAVGNSYYMDLELERATYLLDTTVIYPMPKPHQLRQAIVSLDLPENMVDLAKKTIERSRLDEVAKATPYDGTENFNQYLKNQVQSYYHYGQPAPIKLFDVFSWAEFIKSLKKSKGPIRDKDGTIQAPEY